MNQEGQTHCCSWTVAEVQEYLRHASGIAKARTAREWSVDTSWAISGGMTE